MKKTILLTVCSLMAVALQAQTVSEQQARQIAAEFYQTHESNKSYEARSNKPYKSPTPSTLRKAYEAPQQALYVFNSPEETGFVIVAGKESSTPILGWSDNGPFDYNRAPCGLKAMLEQYAKGLSRREKRGERRENSNEGNHAPRKANVVVAPLIKTQWNQYAPFNKQTVAVTGCVPTAMAQVMKFYNWPKQGRGAHTNFYSGSKSVNFSESVYDWDNMLDRYDEGSYTDTQADAVAKLMYDLGDAVNTHATTNGTGASVDDAYKALVAYFGYDASTIRYISGEYSYPGETLWNVAQEGETITDVTRRLLKEELNAGRPVLLSVWELLHEDGHEVVCDGYNDEDCFHLNFGWGGDSDGYYSLLDSHDIIHNWLDMVVGIQPSKGVRVQLDNLFLEVNDGEACVMACNDGAPADVIDVVIPETVNVDGKEYPVTRMWEGAFYGQRVGSLNTGNVRVIPRDAFKGIYGNQNYQTRLDLKNVTFGPGLERVCTHAFVDNFKLQSATFQGSGYTLETEAFGQYLPSTPVLTQVYGLNGAVEIGDNVFNNIQNISTFHVQPTCKYGISAVGGTFDYIHLPAEVEQFDPNSIGSCAAYEVDADNPNYSHNGDGLLFNKDKTKLLRCPYWTFVDDMASDNRAVRQTVNVPTTVTRIANHALGQFQWVQIPASVTEIEDTTGIAPQKLVMLSPTPPTVKGPRPYWYQRGSLVIPKGSKAAYEQAPVWKDFNNISEELDIDGAYCYVETYAGSGELKLLARNAAVPFDGKAELPATASFNGTVCPVTDIDSYAFRSDEQLTHLTVPTNIQDIPERAFIGCRNLQEATMHADGMSVGERSFEGCQRLQRVTFLGDDIRIGYNGANRIVTAGYSFNGCTALTSVPGLENAQYIGNGSFLNCPLEGNLHFNNLEWGLEGSAFSSTNIENVFLPSSCYKVVSNAFSNCPRLHTIEVDAAHTTYFSNDGILYRHSNKGDQLLLCPLMQKRGGVVIERSSVTIPDGIQSIESEAFGSTLKYVTIPATVTKFGNHAFQCYPVQVTNLATTPQSISDHTAFLYGITATLRVPNGCKPLYETAPGWRQFPTIEEIDPASVTPVTIGRQPVTRSYNLQGQQVGSGYRGIVIRKGKKLIIK